MTKRIFRSIFLMVFVVMMACMAVVMTALYSHFTLLQKTQLRMQTEMVATAVSNEGLPYLEEVNQGDYRITWIDGDGTVIFDSVADENTMENHGQREEFLQALTYGVGESSHFSNTLTTEMIYTAELLDDGTVIRLAVEQYTVASFALLMIEPILILVLLALVASAILATRIARRLVEPINKLDLDDPLANETYEELTPLLRRLAALHRKIEEQVAVLSRQQKEFDLVIGYMSEGFALLTPKGEIYSINKTAADLLGADGEAVGKNILLVNRSPEIQTLVRTALEGKHCDGQILKNGLTHQMVASPIQSGDMVHGVVLLTYDVTEKIHGEQVRREFTANVSHELKTPLHSISGCAEIIKNGLVQPQDIPQFVEQIYNEAQRLVVLVNDIIDLSRLDEGADNIPRETVDLQAIANETAEQLKSYGVSMDVSISVVAEPLAVQGIPRLLREIVYNLVDNAIKYNRKGGRVTISLHDSEEGIHLAVSDTGIGIPLEHQGRIFERFYRVDKSHSKDIGGTGLGLSIVKHGVMLHSGTISMDSVPDRGTTISILFPKL